jgi:hypothetical protein
MLMAPLKLTKVGSATEFNDDTFVFGATRLTLMVAFD